MRPLRIAVVGAGFIGKVHVRAARSNGAEVLGVAASTPERGELAARRLGLPESFPSAMDAATDPRVDVVHVCTPNHLHVELTLAALAAGKHVICEKPVATSAAEAFRMVAAAERAGRIVAVPFVYRFHPLVRHARALVANGELGDVWLLHGSYLQDWLLRPTDTNWRVDDQLGGPSRAFADIGSHWCDLAEFVTGHRIVRLNATRRTTVPHRGGQPGAASFTGASPGTGGAREVIRTEDAAVVSFETDRAAIGSVVISEVSAGRKNRLWLEVDGSRASVAFDQEQPETLWIGRPEYAQQLARDPATLAPGAARYANVPAGHPQGYQDCFNSFVRDVYDAVRGDEVADGLPTADDGWRSATVVDAVLAAASQPGWTAVPLATTGSASTTREQS